MSSGLRAILVGTLMGLIPVILVLIASGGFAPRGNDTLESLDSAYVDERLAAFALTPTTERGRSATTIRTRPVFADPTPIEQEVDRSQAPTIPSERSTAVALEPTTRSAYPGADRPMSPSAPPTRLGAAVPAAVRQWERPLIAAAIAYGVDANLLAALVMTESGGNPDAVSSKGAVGLLQVVGGSSDPAVNLDQGAAILAGHLSHFGRLDLALAAYNAGASTVEKYGGVPPFRETRDHVFRVLVRFDLYSR